MRRPIRTLTVILALAAAGTAFAQSNPISRGTHDSFYYGAIKTQSIDAPLGSSSSTNSIARPAAAFGPSVTPVPEPSEWAMLLAGLALVGFIVRRNAKRP